MEVSVLKFHVSPDGYRHAHRQNDSSPSRCGQGYACTADGVAGGAQRGSTGVPGEGGRGRYRRWTGIAAVE